MYLNVHHNLYIDRELILNGEYFVSPNEGVFIPIKTIFSNFFSGFENDDESQYLDYLKLACYGNGFSYESVTSDGLIWADDRVSVAQCLAVSYENRFWRVCNALSREGNPKALWVKFFYQQFVYDLPCPSWSRFIDGCEIERLAGKPVNNLVNYFEQEFVHSSLIRERMIFNYHYHRHHQRRDNQTALTYTMSSIQNWLKRRKKSESKRV